MGSQFVDFNGDGHLDYITATFDGSPYVSYGSRKGFAAPQQIKDARGRRILISSVWNYKTRKHEDLGRAMPDGKATEERCISALAFDWDGDGDYDLLLGSYERGHLYRQMNEGSNKRPKFTGKNIPVLTGGVPWALRGKMTTPRLVDWDGDGDLDLIAGTFGPARNFKTMGGGVYLARNNGQRGKTEFGPFETLIAPQPKGGVEPVRPDAALYADAVDYDGDGDLDLVVGGHSLYTPPRRRLSHKEQAALAKLEKEQAAMQKRFSKLGDKMYAETDKRAKGAVRGSEEWRTVYSKVIKKYYKQRSKNASERVAMEKRMGEFVPQPRTEGYVWLYERK